MGIFFFADGDPADWRAAEGVARPSARAAESFIVAPPGTAAASSPPPVAARNCLRSTDLLLRELRMPTPRNDVLTPPKIRPAALYASCAWEELTKSFLAGTNGRKTGGKSRADAPEPARASQTEANCDFRVFCGPARPEPGWKRPP